MGLYRLGTQNAVDNTEVLLAKKLQGFHDCLPVLVDDAPVLKQSCHAAGCFKSIRAIYFGQHMDGFHDHAFQNDRSRIAYHDFVEKILRLVEQDAATPDKVANDHAGVRNGRRMLHGLLPSKPFP